ncbi:MAG: hypothetical protein ACOY3Y_14115 [Acidobacteriota bacterium]
MCLIIWVLPGLDAVASELAADPGACDSPGCSCPIPEGGGRCDCHCCSPHDHDASGLPEMCGSCRPNTPHAGVVTLPRVVHALPTVLPVPAVSAAVVAPATDTAIASPHAIPDPVPRSRV